MNKNNQDKAGLIFLLPVMGMITFAALIGTNAIDTSNFFTAIKGIAIIFALFIISAFLHTAIKSAQANSKSNAPKNDKDNTEYNHNRTFHRSEFDRLGIDMNEFAIDKNQYKKDAPSTKTTKNNKPVQKVVEEEIKEEEHEDILKKVISELGESEFSNWRETYEARQNSTFDVKGDK